ncbi:MAG: NUDIX domain-containing protein [Peptococcaceae bacterium]|nr:NUDIX domain-containing protein [Peptococcaceae bacterium]
MKDAVAILIEWEGRYLFVQRPPGDLFEGYWSPPTGKVEPGESQRQAVAREAMEELGLPVIPEKKVWESVTTHRNFVLHWWTAKPLSREIRINENEVSGYAWIYPSEIRSLGKVFDSHAHFFENLKKYLP